MARIQVTEDGVPITRRIFVTEDGTPITRPPVSRGTKGMDNAAMSSTPIDQDYVPDWAVKNPRLYGAIGAARETLGPLIETGALVGGGILAAGGGPYTSVAGAGAGYGLGKEVTGMADQFLGNVPQKSLVDELRETASNVGEGAAYEMGGQAIFPIAKTIGKGIKGLANIGYNTIAAPINATVNLGRGLYKGGREKIIGKTMAEAAGPNANQIIKTLRENKTLNPESRVSAGEIAAPVKNTEFSALNVAADRAIPTVAKAREDASNKAVINELRIIGKDKPTLDAAVKNRTKITDPMYKNAAKSTEIIDVSNVAKLIDASIAKNPEREKLVRVLKDIKKSFTKQKNKQSSGINVITGKKPPLKIEKNAKELISASENIVDKIRTKDPSLVGSAPGASLDDFIVRELNGIKTLLDNTISNKVPAYKKAQEEYKKLSIPIDQMRIGQVLESKLVPPGRDIGIDANLNPKAYAKALREDKKTVGAATNFKRNEGMESVLTPEQMGITQRVAEDIARRANYLDQVKKGSPRTGQIIGDQMSGAQLPNALNRPIMIINNILNRLQGKVQGRSLKEMAIIMQDPQKTAILLQSATQAEKNEIKKLIQSQFFNKIPTQVTQFFNKIPPQPSTVTLQQANELQKLNSGPPFTQEQLQY